MYLYCAIATHHTWSVLGASCRFHCPNWDKHVVSFRACWTKKDSNGTIQNTVKLTQWSKIGSKQIRTTFFMWSCSSEQFQLLRVNPGEFVEHWYQHVTHSIKHWQSDQDWNPTDHSHIPCSFETYLGVLKYTSVNPGWK